MAPDAAGAGPRLVSVGRTEAVSRRSGLVVYGGAASVTVPGIATPVSFAPVEVPPGRSTLTLVASPGPDAIGASDPRQASVFLTQVAARPVLNP